MLIQVPSGLVDSTPRVLRASCSGSQLAAHQRTFTEHRQSASPVLVHCKDMPWVTSIRETDIYIHCKSLVQSSIVIGTGGQ